MVGLGPIIQQDFIFLHSFIFAYKLLQSILMNAVYRMLRGSLVTYKARKQMYSL